jgi:hypothetical protein
MKDSSRQKAKAVFDPSAIDDDLDDLWPTAQLQQRPDAKTARSAPATPPTNLTELEPAILQMRPEPPQAVRVAPLASALATERRPSGASGAKAQSRPTSVTVTDTTNTKRIRPPEVLLSSEVYDELYRVQIAEKKVRRGLARTMGAIVLDAIEAHAVQLATTWTHQKPAAVGEGQLFERPSSNAVPRRRRHVTAPRTIVLSGVTPANAERLDGLVTAWSAGTRSALVEQALRYEFNLILAVS